MEDTVNRPRISKWIGRGYVLVVVFLAGLYAAIAILTDILTIPIGAIVFTTVMIFAIVLVGVITYFFFRTTYVIREGHLRAWSPFASIDLDIKDIVKLEQTRVPFYFRGFGAGLYSGTFFIAGVGWTKVIITNLTDGVLITDKNEKRYLITPSDPSGFVRMIGR